jgi:hypothetical protein
MAHVLHADRHCGGHADRVVLRCLLTARARVAAQPRPPDPGVLPADWLVAMAVGSGLVVMPGQRRAALQVAAAWTLVVEAGKNCRGEVAALLQAAITRILFVNLAECEEVSHR